jgi:hypothetical protein
MKQARPNLPGEGAQDRSVDRALSRIIAEIHDGLCHGFFEITVTCEVIGQERRRLILKAGKTHQFVIPKEDCLHSVTALHDSCDGSDSTAA